LEWPKTKHRQLRRNLGFREQVKRIHLKILGHNLNILSSFFILFLEIKTSVIGLTLDRK
jgi:hypothetical protein